MADHVREPERCIVCDRKCFTRGKLHEHETECIKREDERRLARLKAAKERGDA